MSTTSTSSKSKMTPGPQSSISARKSSSCCDRSSPLRQIRVPHFPETRCILSVISCPLSRNAKARPFEMARAPARGNSRAGAQRGSAVRPLNARDKGLLSCFDNELCRFFWMGDHEEVRRSLDPHDLPCPGALCHEFSRRVRKVLVPGSVDEPGGD